METVGTKRRARRATRPPGAAGVAKGIIGATPSNVDGRPDYPERGTGTLRTAPVATSVGGKALPGAVQLVRVAGGDVDVMLPAGAGFAAYLDALARTGAFPHDAAQIARLQETATSPAPDPEGRPRVGIVLSEPKMLLPALSGEHAHERTATLVALVKGMGCRPVLIPPCADLVVTGGPAARARATAALASVLDGLVGPGGDDVDPSIYGAKNTASVDTNLLRDTFEAAFTKVALDCDLFAFGICRSHQLWNAAAGGSLIQNVEGHKLGSHGLRVTRGSMLFEATRREALRVNSLHHQVVDLVGWGFRVVGRDETSGMIEATERWNGITTQFHPELMQDDAAERALFQTLGRRAHAFALLKEMRPTTLSHLLERMRVDPRFDATDIAWAQRELARRV